ncbi:MAG: hypothetical protein ACKVTZ_17225 [Bacteroidia bacterium]
MASQIFYLNSDNTHQIEVSWSWGWKECKVAENQQIIGEFASPKELREGKNFSLANGSTLFVKLQESIWNGSGLDLQHNGKVVKGSVNDPITQINKTAGVIWAIAILNLVIGIIFYFVMSDEEAKSTGLGMMVVGVLIGVLGYFFKTYRSKASLLAVIALMILDIVMTITISGKANGIIVKVFFIIYLIQGYLAISKAKTAELEEKIEEIGG